MLAVLFSVLLVASESPVATPPANAVVPPATADAPATNEMSDPDRKICRRQQVTGQIQGTKRVCMTAEQWKRTQEASQRRR